MVAHIHETQEVAREQIHKV